MRYVPFEFSLFHSPLRTFLKGRSAGGAIRCRTGFGDLYGSAVETLPSSMVNSGIYYYYIFFLQDTRTSASEERTSVYALGSSTASRCANPGKYCPELRLLLSSSKSVSRTSAPEATSSRLILASVCVQIEAVTRICVFSESVNEYCGLCTNCRESSGPPACFPPQPRTRVESCVAARGSSLMEISANE